MGSKSVLLRGELGTLLLQEAQNSTRFIDLFSGSGSVGHYIAENTALPVVSVDLQHYSSVLAGCITERDAKLSQSDVVTSWTGAVHRSLIDDPLYEQLQEPIARLGKATVMRARKKSSRFTEEHFITRDYGGHYFSPQQAYILDLLYSSLPSVADQRKIGLAAILHAASVCAAAPGHTAQPFQPTKKLLPYIKNSWTRDVIAICQKQVETLANRHATKIGKAIVADAISVAESLEPGDLVFCDPPYSAVQYSRFYHVLEGIALGGWPEVSGAGRAPARVLRETSDFSMKSQATEAMTELLETLRTSSCRVIITFPDADASNGLSARDIIHIAQEKWHVYDKYVDSVHSTLGGSSSAGGRGGRRALQEVVLLLIPKDDASLCVPEPQPSNYTEDGSSLASDGLLTEALDLVSTATSAELS
ncbi:DNA adenine methylase [Paenarthrobacter sp. PH39-S1]|uniref:DNA adenine methylase n=1 Tax=Paenarthrobacter sp. PH39-S1 TaxID=3046204 RepID=UPI0024BA25EA|nr:DNA adenine methylase [Paenarthrobacter sp. PH39-S1]MDJ0357677.1 DNA adenine methylase [Paenarthrobacter sp. PH39-S1]